MRPHGLVAAGLLDHTARVLLAPSDGQATCRRVRRSSETGTLPDGEKLALAGLPGLGPALDCGFWGSSGRRETWHGCPAQKVARRSLLPNWLSCSRPLRAQSPRMARADSACRSWRDPEAREAVRRVLNLGLQLALGEPRPELRCSGGKPSGQGRRPRRPLGP